MAKLKVDSEIKKAKAALELEISETIHIMVTQFHERYPQWLVTDADISVIDVSVNGEQRRMMASSRVELTSKDLETKICKGGQVKGIK